MAKLSAMNPAQSSAQVPPRLSAPRRNERWLWALAFALLILIPFIAKTALEANLGWRCPVLSLLHFPCPSCGSTRALAALTRGELLAAWRFNPLVITAIFAGPLVLGGRQRLARYGRFGWPVFFTLAFLNWLYLLFYLPR